MLKYIKITKGGLYSMYINLLDDIGDVRNKPTCLSILRKLAIGYKDTQNSVLAEKVNECYKKIYYYFNDDYEGLDEDYFSTKFLLIDSGLITEKKESIYFQFSKSAFGWCGAIVDTIDGIINYMSKQDGIDYQIQLPKIKEYIKNRTLTKDNSSKKSSKGNIKGDDSKGEEVIGEDVDSYDISLRKKSSLDCSKTKGFYQDLYDRLLICNDWNLSTNTLRNYIDNIISRINHKIRRGEDTSKYIIMNENHTKAILNSGLLDKFGKTIMFTSEVWVNGTLEHTKLSIVNSKQDLVNEGFKKEDVRVYSPERVEFYNESKLELIFDADIEDFDLDNWVRLSHCISERRERFPENFREASPEVLCQDLITAVKLGVKLSKYDSSYVKPNYNHKEDCISFIIPYHVGNDFQKPAELGIVVHRYESSGLWQVMTILDYDTCCVNAKVLNLYAKESFI